MTGEPSPFDTPTPTSVPARKAGTAASADTAPPGHNLPEYSVTELSNAVKRTMEGEFGRVRVRGEISQPSFPRSGHAYFRLKDENAVLDAVCWRGTLGRLRTRPEEGLEVIASGRLTTYPGASKYQIVVEALELAGEGALLKLLEERKRRLAAEGLFAEDVKQPLPSLPQRIGVVTSPTGAVIRDILHRLQDRFGRPVLVWPVRVQGEGAAEEIVAAIQGFNALPETGPVPRPDLLIVARGGGSLEDLWAFNEEIVVRAVAASTIPLISAIGHETDTTLIDFAADRRAPTPTAAAEMAVPVREELLAALLSLAQRLAMGLGRDLEQRRLRLEGLGRGLGDPRRLLEERWQRLDDRTSRLDYALRAGLRSRQDRLARAGAGLRHPRDLLRQAEREVARLGAALPGAIHRLQQHRQRELAARAVRLRDRPLREVIQAGTRETERLATQLDRGMGQCLQQAQQRLALAGKLLDSYSYERVLERGFAVVRDEAGKPVTRAAGLQPGAALALEFRDGRTAARVVEAASEPESGGSGPDAAPQGKKTGKKTGKTHGETQGKAPKTPQRTPEQTPERSPDTDTDTLPPPPANPPPADPPSAPSRKPRRRKGPAQDPRQGSLL